MCETLLVAAVAAARVGSGRGQALAPSPFVGVCAGAVARQGGPSGGVLETGALAVEALPG